MKRTRENTNIVFVVINILSDFFLQDASPDSTKMLFPLISEHINNKSSEQQKETGDIILEKAICYENTREKFSMQAA